MSWNNDKQASLNHTEKLPHSPSEAYHIVYEKENKMQKFHSDAEAEVYVKNAMSRIFSTATNILKVSEKHELPSPVIDAAQQISRMVLTAYGQAYRPEATEALSEFFTPGKP